MSIWRSKKSKKFKKAKLIKLLALTPVVTAIPLIAASCNKSDPIQVSMICDNRNWKDGGYLQSAYSGLIEAQKKLAKQNINIRVTSPQTAPDGSTITLNNMVRIAIINGSSVIVCVGFNYLDSIQQMAANYKNIKFLIVDSTGVSPNNNLYGIQFPEQESGYLTGVLNGLIARLDPERFGKTTSDTVNFAAIAGAKFSTVTNYIFGYQIGLQYLQSNQGWKKMEDIAKANKITLPTKLTKLKFQKTTYLDNNFDNANNAGTTASLNMLTSSNPADEIFEVAGGTGKAIINAAKSVNLGKAPTKYIVGVDSDLYSQGVYTVGSKNYSVVINSAIKNITNIADEFIRWMYTAGPIGTKLKENNPWKFDKNLFVNTGNDPKNPKFYTARVQNDEVGTTPNTKGITKDITTIYNNFYKDFIAKDKPDSKTGEKVLTNFFIFNGSNFQSNKPFYSQDMNFTCDLDGKNCKS